MKTPTAHRLWGFDAVRLTVAADTLVVGAKGTVTFPLPAFLIEHEQGLVMFDTGLSPLACEDPRGYFGPLYDLANPITSPDLRLDRQLAKLGFRPDDVSHVVLSHSHMDHSGGLTMFPHAKFYVGPGELEFAVDHPPEGDKYFRYEQEIAPTLGYDWTTISTPSFDLFGDGAIELVHTPGHTPGELAAKVRLPSQTMILTGDTVHLRAGLELMSPDPYDWDKEKAVKGLEWLSKEQESGTSIWIAHDPEDFDKYGPLVPQE